ncbi:MAG: 30S ribosomal protein S17 [Chloroflexota bacterium]
MREHRKRLIGIVTSSKMDKTVVVTVAQSKQHPLYGKVMRLQKKYMAHDEKNECNLGDRVEIIESRPISARKRWAVVSILSRTMEAEE